MASKAQPSPQKTYDEATHQWIETPPAAPAAPADAPAPATPPTKSKE